MLRATGSGMLPQPAFGETSWNFSALCRQFESKHYRITSRRKLCPLLYSRRPKFEEHLSNFPQRGRGCHAAPETDEVGRAKRERDQVGETLALSRRRPGSPVPGEPHRPPFPPPLVATAYFSPIHRGFPNLLPREPT